jgi:pyridoxamine 5'-phosphate oxidase
VPGLSEDDLDPDPIAQFLSWYAEAGTDAVALVTAGADGVPGGRMVLLKGADALGFTFFTNYTSAKARDLAANPQAALLFHWPPDRQVRVTGPVTKVRAEESDAYWRTRARNSRLSAWASHQSGVIGSRAQLEERVAEFAGRFPDDVPRPPYWGGYRLTPRTLEFWHHREDRLHDRLRYRRHGNEWVVERLCP